MSRLLTVALILSPLTASADGTEAPSVCASCVVAPAPAPVPRPVELSHRWGVAARAVSMSLADAADNQTEYSGGGFAVSYRIDPRWELALTFDALDAPEGPDLHASTLTARFHLAPLRRWDWYLLAGIGAMQEVPLEGESADQAPTRGTFHAGVGLARRFPRWSLAAELHGLGVGPADSTAAMTTARESMPTSPMATDDNLSGGQLTVAASFYF